MCQKEVPYSIRNQEITLTMSTENSNENVSVDNNEDKYNLSFCSDDDETGCERTSLSDANEIIEKDGDTTSINSSCSHVEYCEIECRHVPCSDTVETCSSHEKNPESLEKKYHLEDTLANHENKGKECRISESEKLQFQALVTQCELKLEEVGHENKSLRNEVAELRLRLSQQEVEFKRQETKIKTDFLVNIEKLTRECNSLQKEKETIVIRYANSEKEVIMGKKVQQELEKKLKDSYKDREALLSKLKNSSAENSKLSSSLENKMVELAKLQKENDKLNADFNSREVRIKWLQNKLKTEVIAHQETQNKLDHTQHRLNEMREEAEQVRKDCQEMIKCYQEAEEIKSVKLDGQLKQKLSELEVQKQEKTDQEQIYVLLRQELEALKKKQRLTMEENNALTLKINSLEKERLEYEQTLCKLKDNQNLLKEEIADMTSKLAEMEGLKLQLDGEREKSAASLREVERLRLTNAELQSDLDACHIKEGDRLDFVEKLTAKTMLLQSDHCLLEVKAQALEDEVNQLKRNLADVQQKYAQIETEFTDYRNEHETEMHLLVQKLAEKVKNVEKLNTRLEESENENRVLKRRHIVSIKELSRELYQCKRRLELFESNSGALAESVSLGSRSSSSASLHISNCNDYSTSSTCTSVMHSGNKDTPIHEENAKNNSEKEFKLDKEVLIERIIHLQKLLAKKTDKIDFLEDHIAHLVREMRKKPKSVDFKNV